MPKEPNFSMLMLATQSIKALAQQYNARKPVQLVVYKRGYQAKD